MARKRNRIGALELYTNLLVDFIKDGSQDNHKQLGDDKLQIEFQKLYSRNTTKVFFYVKAFPRGIAYSFMNYVRRVCESDLVNINYTIHMNPHIIDWNSSDMKYKREQWGQTIKERRRLNYDEPLETGNARQLTAREEWLIDSWAYVLDLSENNHMLVESDFIIEIATKINSEDADAELKKAINKFKELCAKSQIQAVQVKNFMYNFIKYISPFYVKELDGNEVIDIGKKFINTRVLSDETFSQMIPYTPGKLMDKGVLLGIDISTGKLVYKNFIRGTADAENFLICADTGGGKSALVKALLIELMANDFICIVLDRDGEYIPLANALEGTVLSLGKASGMYFDAMKIGDLTGIPKIDDTLYFDAITATTGVFDLLSDVDSGMNSAERKILNDAYTNLLTYYDIDKNNRDTWSRSSNLSYFKLYEEIKRLSKLEFYTKRYGMAILDFVDKLSVFFELSGLRSYLFQKPISLSEIIKKSEGKAPIIDIVMDISENGQNTKEAKIEDALKEMTASYLSISITNYYRARNRFSVHVIEEYQRYAKDDATQKTVLSMITDNRKRNAITLTITNSPQDITALETSQSRAILENTNNLMIGRLKPETIHQICDKFKIPNCEGILNHIADKEEKYRYTFLTKINDNEIAIVRALIPKSLADTDIFKTRDKGDEIKNEKEKVKGEPI